MDSDPIIYPYYASWYSPDANGKYHSYSINYPTANDPPELYIDGYRVTDAEFAARYGHFLPAVAIPHASRPDSLHTHGVAGGTSRGNSGAAPR